MHKIIIGIEGTSYSGKTTLCNYLEKNNDNYVVVCESPKFAGQKIHITNNNCDIISNSIKTLEIEELRTKFANLNKNKLLLFDRTIFSFVSISYAYYKTNIIDYFCDYVDKVIEEIKKGNFLVPDYLVYLDISDEELKLRTKIRRKNLPEYWTSKKFTSAAKSILAIICKYYNDNNRLLYERELNSLQIANLSKINKEEVIRVLGEIKNEKHTNHGAL